MKTLSMEATEALLDMIAFCISQGVSMGMSEGLNSVGTKQNFRIELETLVQAKIENVVITYK